MKNAEEENKSKSSSSKSSRTSASKTSKRSKTSNESRSCGGLKSSREKELINKIRLTQLTAESELLQQKQIIEWEEQKLKVREELAKVSARARVSAYNEMKPVNFEEAITHKEKQLDHNSRYHRPDYAKTS